MIASTKKIQNQFKISIGLFFKKEEDKHWSLNLIKWKVPLQQVSLRMH